MIVVGIIVGLMLGVVMTFWYTNDRSARAELQTAMRYVVVFSVIAGTFYIGAITGQGLLWSNLQSVYRGGNNLYVTYTRNPFISPFMKNNLSLALGKEHWDQMCQQSQPIIIRPIDLDQKD